MSIHCCEQMDHLLQDTRVQIGYIGMHREYFIKLRPSRAIQLIDYCPWCGQKLPKALSAEWYEILESLLGEVIYELDYSDERIPEEFRDETWWIKRNL